MDISKNRGTPKSSILIGFSIINYKPSILGYPYSWKHPNGSIAWIYQTLTWAGRDGWILLERGKGAVEWNTNGNDEFIVFDTGTSWKVVASFWEVFLQARTCVCIPPCLMFLSSGTSWYVPCLHFFSQVALSTRLKSFVFSRLLFRELGEKVRLMCFLNSHPKQHTVSIEIRRKTIMTGAYKKSCKCPVISWASLHQLGKLTFEPPSKSAFWGLQIKINRPALSILKTWDGKWKTWTTHKSGLTRLWLSYLSPLVGSVTRTPIQGFQHVPLQKWKQNTDNGQQERCWLKAANQARGEDDGSKIRRSPVDMVNMAHYLHGS